MKVDNLKSLEDSYIVQQLQGNIFYTINEIVKEIGYCFSYAHYEGLSDKGKDSKIVRT